MVNVALRSHREPQKMDIFDEPSMRSRESNVFGGNWMTQSSRPSLDSYVLGEMGGRLRAAHDEVVKEGIPAHFAALLKRLDTADRPPNPGNLDLGPGSGAARETV